MARTDIWAAETSSIRMRSAEQLRSEFPYRPKPVTAANRGDADNETIQMAPVVVTEKKDRSEELARFYRTRRQQELDWKPSLEGGASIDTPRAVIGPRPYRDLLKEDARFKTDKAITPTWNLLDIKF